MMTTMKIVDMIGQRETTTQDIVSALNIMKELGNDAFMKAGAGSTINVKTMRIMTQDGEKSAAMFLFMGGMVIAKMYPAELEDEIEIVFQSVTNNEHNG